MALILHEFRHALFVLWAICSSLAMQTKTASYATQAP